MNPLPPTIRSIAAAVATLAGLAAFAAPAAPPVAPGDVAPPTMLAPSPPAPTAGASAPGLIRMPAPAPATGPTGKPWVDDFAAYVNASTGGRRWVVGRSGAGCLSEHEASESAARDAVRQLIPRLHALRAVPPPPESEVWFKQRLMQDILVARLVKDRWVTRVQKSYGELWTEAVLVDASVGHLTPILRDHDAWLRGRQSHSRNTAASIFGMSVAVVVIYAFVNVITKGYFRCRLRAAAAFAIASGAFLISWSAAAAATAAV
jgi:hypothetical protein